MRLYTAILMVAVLILSALTGAAAGAPSEGQGNGGDSGSASGFIVVLDSGDPNDVAAEHSQRHNAEVSHVYTTALRGYAAQMSEQAADRVARDDRVAYVDRDGEVHTLHHECSHSGGPPGSDPPDCSDPDSGTVSGTVTDSGTDDGISDASVVLDGTETYSTTTDGGGTYSIPGVDGGDYTATADADGYDPESKEITVDGDTTINFALTESSDGGDDSGDQTVPWGIDRIGAPTAHDDSTGVDIRIYVIDTGIDVEHSDLDVAADGYAVEECKGGGCSAPWDDDHGHGTHVAGTAAALDNDLDVLGVAPDARLYAVKVLSKNGRGTRSGVIAGIDWVTTETERHGQPTVANMSLGGSGSKDHGCTDDGLDGSDAYHEAICNAKNAGVVFSVAAGNSGADAQDSVPAAYDDAVITVSATTEGDDWPSWSNWGADSAGWTDNDSAPVALAAPGVDILSTRLGGGTTTKSGTSMAAPHVAGAAALYLDANSESANHSAFANTRSSLLNTAESTTDFSNTSGNPHAEDFLSVD